LICLEEPENGIHPERIAAMLHLLQDIAAGPSHPVGLDNPLRQVIINTHSPAVVGQIPDDSLLIAEPKDTIRGGSHFRRVCFSYLPGTWREARALEAVSIVARGKLLSYLNPFPSEEAEDKSDGHSVSSEQAKTTARVRRVVDRPDMKQLTLSQT